MSFTHHGPRGGFFTAVLLSVWGITRGAVAVDLWEPVVDPDGVAARAEVAQAESVLRAAGRAAREARLLGDPEPVLDPMRHAALDRYRAALAWTPDDVPTLSAAASVAEALGEHTAARGWIDHALTLQPDGPDAPGLLFDRALVHTRMDDFAAARDDYVRELEFPLDPMEQGVVLGNLADTYISLGSLPRAADAYERCVAAAPGYTLGWLGLAVTYDRDGRGDATDAARLALQSAHGDLVEALDSPGVFFVPAYDRDYYAGMAWEAVAASLDASDFMGARRVEIARESALAAWQSYVRSATPQDPWRARAQVHVTALTPAPVPAPVTAVGTRAGHPGGNSP